jgi:calcium/calmodulin-dependent protein kinase I
MAPELLEERGHGKPVDLWAIGVMTFFLLSGYLPFQTHNSIAEINLVLKADFSFDKRYWGDVSDQAKDFISKLIVVDPRKRMNVLEALEVSIELNL